MTTSYTPLLGLALPTTGELAGLWGEVVNNSITTLLEASIAGTSSGSVASGNWTLSTTGDGAANEARSAILRATGSPGAARRIIAPGHSKAYIVINETEHVLTVGHAASGAGADVAPSSIGLVAWNGSQFVAIVKEQRNYTVSTSQPSGGKDGDIWLVVE